MRHAEPFFVSRGPNRFEIRVIKGKANREVGLDAYGPWSPRPPADLLHRLRNGPVRNDNERLQTMRVSAAEVACVAVVCADECKFNLDVINTSRRKPAWSWTSTPTSSMSRTRASTSSDPPGVGNLLPMNFGKWRFDRLPGSCFA